MERWKREKQVKAGKTQSFEKTPGVQLECVKGERGRGGQSGESGQVISFERHHFTLLLKHCLFLGDLAC